MIGHTKTYDVMLRFDIDGTIMVPFIMAAQPTPPIPEPPMGKNALITI